jgi:hypothetical protein
MYGFFGILYVRGKTIKNEGEDNIRRQKKYTHRKKEEYMVKSNV